MAGKFDSLDKFNTFLGDVPGYLDKGFGNFVHSTSQTAVDAAALGMANSISWTIEEARRGLIHTLHLFCVNNQNQLNKLSKLANMKITDPLKLLEPVLAIQSILCEPYFSAMTALTELSVKLTEITTNLARIASYQPPTMDLKPSPGVFKIQTLPITMEEVLSGQPKKLKLSGSGPTLKELNQNAQAEATKKFQDSTAKRAETTTTNENKTNTLKFATVNDPTGKSGTVEEKWKFGEANTAKGTGNKAEQSITANVDNLEKKLLGYKQPEQPIAYRLGVLEHALFGNTYAGGLQERLDRIEQAVKDGAKQKAHKKEDL